MTTEAARHTAKARAPGAVRPGRGLRRALNGALKHLGVAALSVTMIYPLIWLVVASLRPESLIFREPGLVRGLVIGTLKHALAEAGWRTSTSLGGAALDGVHVALLLGAVCCGVCSTGGLPHPDAPRRVGRSVVKGRLQRAPPHRQS